MNKTIRINKAASYTKNGIVIKSPKTAAGNRVLSLPAACFELLNELKKVQDEGGTAGGLGVLENAGEILGASGYVFRDELKDGQFIPPQRVSDKFKSVIKRHNRKYGDLPVIRLHDLRHTAATLLISHNVDVETVARRLGHSNPSITLNIYAHPTAAADYKASLVLETMLA